jgi:hypothetical protein
MRRNRFFSIRQLPLMIVLITTLACTLPAISRPSPTVPSPTATTATAPRTPTRAFTATPTMTSTPRPAVTPTRTRTPRLPTLESGARTVTPTRTRAPIPTSTPGPLPTPSAGALGPGFATYSEVSVSLPAAYEGYALPLNLETVKDLDQSTLSDTQRALLERNGFVVTPAGWLEFYPLYSALSHNRPWLLGGRQSLGPRFIAPLSRLSDTLAKVVFNCVLQIAYSFEETAAQHLMLDPAKDRLQWHQPRATGGM